MPLRARLALSAAALSVIVVAAFAAVPGSPFQPVLPAGAGPAGPFRWLGEALGFARLDGDAAAYVGAVLLLLAAVAFALLLFSVSRGEVPLRAVLVFAVAAQLSMALLPLLFSRDVYSYAAYGRIVAVHGANPYLVTPQDIAPDPLVALVGPKWVDTPSVYGPAWTSISAGVAAAAATPAALVAWFRVIAIVAGLATTLLIVPVVRRLAPGREALAVAAFGCNPVVLFHAVASGHNDLLVALGVIGALGLVGIGRHTLAAVVLSVAALIKAPAAVPLLLLFVWLASRADIGSRWRAIRWPVAASVGVGFLFAAPYMQKQDPTLGLLELAGHEGWLAPSRFLSRLVGAIPVVPLAGAVRIAFAVAVVIAVVVVARRVRLRAHDGATGLGAAWGWGLLALMLLGPVLLPWYVVWALPVAWILPRDAWRALVGTSLALQVSLFATEPDPLGAAYSANIFIGHWVITPVVVALLVFAARDLVTRVRLDSALAGDASLTRGEPR